MMMVSYAPELVALGVAVLALILAHTNERRGMSKGIDMARKLADQEATYARALAVAARDKGFAMVAERSDAQADILRSLSMQLQWEKAARFLSDPE